MVYIMGLFMRPITPQPLCPIIVRGWAGGYRILLLDVLVIGAILIGLSVIGLAGAMVIGPLKVSNNFENITGRDPGGQVSENNENYYQGILGMYYIGHTRGNSGQDMGRGIGQDGTGWYIDCSPLGRD
jgi:hypothetical protein